MKRLIFHARRLTWTACASANWFDRAYTRTAPMRHRIGERFPALAETTQGGTR